MSACSLKIITLDQLKVHEKGRIVSIQTTSREIKRRLLDMGLTPGVIVTIKKIAPLGDPYDIHLRDYDICIRKHELKQIEVIPV